MELQLLLEQLSSKKIKLSLNNNETELLIRAPKGSLNDAEKITLRENKAEIIELLKANSAVNKIVNETTQLTKPVFTKKQFTAFNGAQNSIYFHNRSIKANKENLIPPYIFPVVFEAEDKLNIDIINASLRILANYHPSIHSEIAEQTGLVGLITKHKELSAQQHSVVSKSAALELIQQLLLSTYDTDNSATLFSCHSIEVAATSNTILFIYIHHLICDVQLAHILLKDFISIYNQEEITNSSNLFQSEKPSININKENNQHSISPIECDIFYNRLKNDTTYQSEYKTIIDSPQHVIQKLCINFNCNTFELFFASFCLSLFKYTQQNHFHIDFAKSSEEYFLSASLSIQHHRASINFSQNCKTFSDIIEHCRHSILEAVNTSTLDVKQNATQIKNYRPIVFSFNQKTFNPSFELQGIRLNLLDLKHELIPGEAQTTSSPLWPLLIAIDYQADQQQQTIHSFASDEVNREFHQQTGAFTNDILFQLTSGENQLSRISLLNDSDKRQLFKHYQQNFNSTLISTKPIHHHFEQQVKNHPYRLAIQDSQQSLNYQQLNQQANQLAHHIASLISASEITTPYIAIMVDRSNQSIIALLAILKSGCAYVPINKLAPARQQQHIINEAKPQLLIHDSTESQLNKSQDYVSNKLQFININDKKQWETNTTSNLQISPNNSFPHFNLLYTSGTTGQAKGIKMSHKAMLAHLLWMQSAFAIDKHSNILHKTPLGFDVSVWEIFLPLISGATLTLLDESAHKEPRAILSCISKHKITLCHFVPSMLEAFNQWYSSKQDNHKPNTQSLQQLICSGERLYLQLAQDTQSIFPRCEIFNLYGPTECAIDITQHSVSQQLQHLKHNLALTQDAPIGKAVKNTDIYITDPHGQLSAIGAKGELHVASVQLSSGYLNASKKTAKSFTDNPYFLEGSNWPTLYKTGDVASLSNNHELMFYGRIDEQIKLRGQRFELSSLNYLLQDKLQLPLLSCLLSADKQSITAYYSGHLNLQLQEINHFLENSIAPDFIPQRWIKVNTWPLTINGKLDKTILQNTSSSQLEETLLAPSEIVSLQENKTALAELKIVINNTSYDEALFLIFDQHLQGKLWLNRSFVEQGGHSLLALSITQSIYRETQQHISVQCFFVPESLSFLIYFISDSINHSHQFSQHYGSRFDNISTIAKELTLFSAPSEFNGISFSQQSIANFEALKTGLSQYHLPIAFRATIEPENNLKFINALKFSCITIINAHPALQCIFPEFKYQQRLSLKTINHLILKADENTSAKLLPTFIYTHLTHEKEFSDRAIATLIDQDYLNNLKIDQQLPIRFQIYQTCSEYLIIITLHHIAVDAISINSLSDEFQHIFSEYCDKDLTHEMQTVLFEETTDIQERDKVNTSESTIFDYAYSQQLSNDKHQKYWLNLLNNIEPYCNLPSSNSPPSENKEQTASVKVTLASNLSESIFLAASKVSGNAHQILLSSFQLLLHSLTEQSSLAIATTINGRPKELQNCVGMMVNTIPAHSIVNNNLTLHEYIEGQITHFDQAIQHQHISLEALANQLKISRQLNKLPFAQIGFNLLGIRPKNSISINTDIGTLEPIFFSNTPIKNELTLTAIIDQHGISLQFDYSTARFNKGQVSQWQQDYTNLLETLSQLIITENSPLTRLSEIINIQLNNPITFIASATQTDIYLDDLILHNGIKNHIGFITRSATPLDPSIWQQAMFDSYCHFDALRSQASVEKSKLIFVINNPDKNLFNQTFNWHKKTTDIESEKTRHFIQAELLNKSFKQGSLLWRSALISFKNNQSVFIMAAHHALLDGISLEIIGRYIKDRYQQLLDQDSVLNTELSSTETMPFITGLAITADDYLTTIFTLQNLISHYNPLQISNRSFSPSLNALETELIEKPARLSDLSHINFSFSQTQWQDIQLACRSLRTTPPQYFKALFSLCIKVYHLANNDIVFFEVVSGRNKENMLNTGVLFQQNINLLPASINFNSSFNESLKHFSQWRKKIKILIDLSPSSIQRIFPELSPYIFNFYIMETATDFLDGKEQVSHIQPEIPGAVNLITSLIDNSLSLDLYFPNNHLKADSFSGTRFLSYILQANQELLASDDIKNIKVNSLFPFIDQESIANTLENQVSQPINYQQLKNHAKTKGSNKQHLSIPLDTLETKIIAIWQQVLQIDAITLDSNFFELGGHSLLAIELAQQLQLQCGIHVELLALLNQPTVSGLINTIISGQSQVSELPLPARSPAGVINAVYPLSFNQKRLWLLEAINPKLSSEFVMRAAFSLKDIDINALSNAIIFCLNSDPNYQLSLINNQQQILKKFKQSDIIFTNTTLKYFTQHIQSSSIALHHNDSQNSHKLVRIFINQSNKQTIQLGLIIHHFIADAKTLELLASNLLQAYQKIQLGLEPTINYPELNYLDFINYQKNIKNSPAYKSAIDYWVSLLSPLDYQRVFISNDTILDDQEDNKNAISQPYQSKHYNIELPNELSKSLQDCAAKASISLFTLLITAYGQSICALSNKRKCPIALPRDGRSHIEFSNSAGFYTNIIIFDYDNQTYQTLETFLRDKQSQLLKSYRYDFIDIDDINKALKLPRDLNHLPYAQFAFNYIQHNNLSKQMIQPLIDSFSIQAIELEHNIAQFECLLNVQVLDNSIQADLEYKYSEFSDNDIKQLSLYFIDTLQLISDSINKEPRSNNTALTTADLLSIVNHPVPAGPSNHYLNSFTQKPYSESYLNDANAFDFLQAFTLAVIQQPDKIAIRTQHLQLSYQELDTKSEQLAIELLKLSSNNQVATSLQMKCLVVLDNCPEIIISLLALWKANILYSLMDARQNPVLIFDKHAQFSSDILIAKSSLVSVFQQHSKTKSKSLFSITADNQFEYLSVKPILSKYSISKNQSKPNTNDLAYTVFTSGTTGTPKAISVYRQSFQRLLYWYINELELTKNDSTIIFSSPQFDLTQKNYFSLLAVGGCIELFQKPFDPKAISDLLINKKFSYINCAPSAIYPILSSAHKSITPNSVTIVLGGETIDTINLAKLCNDQQFQGDIINTYGPSECTDIVSFCRINQQLLQQLANCNRDIPLGQTLPFSEICLLDDAHKILPAGFTGQLAISGKQLANAANNDRFINNHLSSTSNFLYLSADMARIDPNDGQLYYLGRNDQEVKILGQRINLNTVKQAFNQFIHGARIELLFDSNTLIAFIDNQAYQDVKKTWRQTLSKLLAQTFIPSQLIPVEYWPLTVNGKSDQQALINLAKLNIADTEPLSTLKETLTAAERHYLKLIEASLPDRISSIDDNYFMLGGNSLSVIQLCQNIYTELQLSLSPSDVFLQPEIHCIIERLQTLALVESSNPLFIPINNETQSHTIVIGFPALGFSPYSFSQLAKSCPNTSFYGINYSAIDFSNSQALLQCCLDIIDYNKINNALDISNIIFIGHSVGGTLAAETLLKFHARIDNKNDVGINSIRLILLDALTATKIWPKTLYSQSSQILLGEHWQNILQQSEYQSLHACYEYFRAVQLPTNIAINSHPFIDVTLVKANPNNLPEKLSPIKYAQQKSWQQTFPHLQLSQSSATHLRLLHEDIERLAELIKTEEP